MTQRLRGTFSFKKRTSPAPPKEKPGGIPKSCPPSRRYDSRPLFVAANRAAFAHRWAIPVSERFAPANRGPASNPACFLCRRQRFAGFLETASLYPPLAVLRRFPPHPLKAAKGRACEPLRWKLPQALNTAGAAAEREAGVFGKDPDFSAQCCLRVSRCSVCNV